MNTPTERESREPLLPPLRSVPPTRFPKEAMYQSTGDHQWTL